MTKIVYIPFGIANRYGDTIELNENLKNYPKLHEAILNHELSHTEKKGMTKQDFIVDFGEHNVDNKELIKFMIQNPKSFYQLLPVYKKENVLFYDINMIIYFSLILLGMCLSAWFVFTL